MDMKTTKSYKIQGFPPNAEVDLALIRPGDLVESPLHEDECRG